MPDDTHTVTVTVTNVFEDLSSSTRSRGYITRSVPENTVADQPVGPPVSATDDEGDTLTYELGGTDADSFAIDTDYGPNQDQGRPGPRDQGLLLSHRVPSGMARTTMATRMILSRTTHLSLTSHRGNRREREAHFDATQPVEYRDRRKHYGGHRHRCRPKRHRPGPDRNKDTLTYTLDSDSAATFEIDTLGQIKTKAALDHETTATYNVTVTVRDSRDDNGDPDTADDATIAVTITVTDEDDPGNY